MVYTDDVAKQSLYKREVVKKIGGWLAEDGLQTTILKGFSLSALYPNSNLREFSDIDIFSGKDYDAVNSCFAKHGIEVDSVDGHHAYLNVDGVSVEHHFAFHNTKVKNGLVGPEEALQRLVVLDSKQTSIPGINFPNAAFTALFVGWHAYEHFLQEKIQLRHIIDWTLSLIQLNETEAEIVSKVKNNTKWGQFIDVLTAIALHQLHLPNDWIPEQELVAAQRITMAQEQRVWNDILCSPRTSKGINSTHRRIKIAKRMLSNDWKFKTYSDISAKSLVYQSFIGHACSKWKISLP